MTRNNKHFDVFIEKTTAQATEHTMEMGYEDQTKINAKKT